MNTSPYIKVTKRCPSRSGPLWRTLFILTLLLSGPYASAARVLFYQAEHGNPDIESRLTLACRFYGIELEKTKIGLPRTALDSEPLAVVIEAACHPPPAPTDIPKEARSLLIAGINNQSPPELSIIFGNGKVQFGADPVDTNLNRSLQVSSIQADLTQELTGQHLPALIAEGFHLQADPTAAIISYNSDQHLMVETQRKPFPIYWLADVSMIHPPNTDIWFYDHGFFVEIAPYMLFLKQAFGEYAWHADEDYANLTIDDPWLCDTFGSLSFSELLKEMDLAGFHTTIAFIPWNYDRTFSQTTVDLFLNRPDRFSICMHGNNHDHYEFDHYEKVAGGSAPAKPFTEQEADIRQGLARMDAFKNNTGLLYDPIMVFPHGISPEPTLGLLKKYNILATSNIGNVPLGTPPPQDPLFWLRQTSDAFMGLASLDRTHTVDRTASDIAIDLFLDNPVLFVEHLRFFKDSPAVFNETAELVNQLQPNIRWVSLKTLANHLYLMRKENESTYIIRSFSSDIILHNRGQSPRTYRVTKNESTEIPIEQVLVNDHPAPHSQSNGSLHVNISIPPGTKKHLQIIYQNDFDPASEDISKDQFRINTLRRLSDFRDLYLSSGLLGQLIDRFYYDTNLYIFGLKGLAILAITILFILSVTIISIWRHKKRNQS